MLRFVCVLLTLFCVFSLTACRSKKQEADYRFNKPSYDDIALVASKDTLHFLLNKIDNSIASINTFSAQGIEYIAIYKVPSETVDIYELYSQKLIKTISLALYVLNKKHSTSVYCKNFDSIFINNNKNSLFMTDSSGKNKRTFLFPEGLNPGIADFVNNRPPVLKDSCFYASFPVSGRNVDHVNNWSLMWRIDLKNNKQERLYHMPKRYINNFYGFDLMKFSYCFNNRRNFVFSFPADSNLYETDLDNLNCMFYGRSKFQQGDIEPLSKNKIGSDGEFEYLERDSYGPVFFDPYHKRYLRIFMHKLSRKDIDAKNYDKEKSVLIFNEELRLVGESSFSKKGVLFSSLFFTADGCMYARVKPKDKAVLHFVRFIYKEKSSDSISFAQTKKK